MGDSITAGYRASNSSTAYPGVLQSLFDEQFGTQTFEVSNFGAGGATVRRDADSPYWNRSQYTQFVAGRWDVVVVMLGTNDAKDNSTGGPANWPSNCSLPSASVSNCGVMRDYLALIDIARTLGAGGATMPHIAIATPPPLWCDAAYGMNQTVINSVMPRLVKSVAEAANLPPPIDVFGAWI